jgi:hypothetical protein
MKIPTLTSVRKRQLPKLWTIAGLVFAILISAARASDLIGVYAFVDKVVMEPNDKAPERIQVWGGFALAEGSGSTYAPAQRGYLYYKLPPGKEKAALKEWSDLKSMAGSDQFVGFGARYGEKRTVRSAETKPENPDVYGLDIGLIKVKPREDYEPHKDLLKLRKTEKAAATKPAR